jgi:hypothetical protein
VQHRIGMAIVCLHISAVLYFLLGGAFAALFFVAEDTPEGTIVAILMMVVCLAFIIGIEFVAYGLKKRKFWAWIAALCIFGLYVPSLFLPLGALGIWGLLDAGSREQFGIQVKREVA